MYCPKCGYDMGDLETECARCKRMGAPAPGKPEVTAPQYPALLPPPGEIRDLKHLLRLVLIGVACCGVILIAIFVAVALDTSGGHEKRRVAESHPQPSAVAPPYTSASSYTPASAAIAPDTSADTVYGTRTGKCYHRAGCNSLRRSQIPMTKAQAAAQGLRPCMRCNP